MDVRDLAHPVATHFFTSNGRPNGAWAAAARPRRRPASSPRRLTVLTIPPPAISAARFWNARPQVAKLLDSFTPSNWKHVNAADLDMGSGSLLTFPFQGHVLAASEGKEGVLYLLDTASLGGPDHATPYLQSPQLGNDAALGTQPGQGLWGAMATYLTPDGRRFIYQPMWGPPSTKAPTFQHNAGPIPHGSIMAFELTMADGKPQLVPAWTSPDMTVPDSPTVANGVVYSHPDRRADPAVAKVATRLAAADHGARREIPRLAGEQPDALRL